jgi:hypothetical protein
MNPVLQSSFYELRMVQHVEQESDVGLDALDLRLLKRTDGLSSGILKCHCPEEVTFTSRLS